MSGIQSVIFDKEKWPLFDSHQWLVKHDIYPIKSPHITNNFIRYRIKNPEDFNRMRMKDVGSGIKLIIGFH